MKCAVCGKVIRKPPYQFDPKTQQYLCAVCAGLNKKARRTK